MNLYKNQNVLFVRSIGNDKLNKTSQGKLLALIKFIGTDGHYFYAAHFADLVHLYLINEMGIFACSGKITNCFDFWSVHGIKSE